MPLPSGTRLGSYEIVALLGAGGMGEVYCAHDTKLGRDVALKFLTAASDPAARGRFEREARTIASLNHPNIVTIFAVEEADAQSFLAMELIEGRTLGDVIPDGGMPVDTLLRYAIPIAEALSAAHEHGITHRDLKPSNVMVTKDGRVKVLDFGLAKLRDDIVQLDATVGATRPVTREGQIVGTVAYMSPEQASGATIDPRSDLFSFGVMLYEMATGERPFKGGGGVETLAAILKDAPKTLTELRPHLPRDLARIVRRALAKDPELRYQTAKDLRNDLQTLRDDLTSGDVPVAMPAMQPRTRRTAGMLVAVAVTAAAIGALGVYFAVRPRPAVTRAPDDAAITRLTTTGRALQAAISPDGRYVAYVANDNGMYSVWMRQAATASNVQIVPPGPNRFHGLTFSPDGDYVYFTRFSSSTGADLYRVPALGGPPQPVVADVDSPVTFSPDGSRMAFIRGYPARNEISIVVGSGNGSEAWTRIATRPFTSGFIIPSRPAWSPDGRTIAAAVGGMRLSGFLNSARSSIVGIDVATGKERAFTAASWDTIETVTWLDDGSLVVSGTQQGRPNDQLWRVLPDGSMRRITNDLNAYSDVAAATKSAAIVAVLSDFRSTISTTSPDGAALATQVTTGTGRHDGETGIAWTPDGRVVFGSAAGGQIDLWIADADGRNARQLTSDAAAELTPSVTPDGRAVLFSATRQNQAGIWRLDLASGAASRVTEGSSDFFPQCLPDNQTLVFMRLETGGVHAYRGGLSGGIPSALPASAAWPLVVSPDGRLMASLTTTLPIRVAVTSVADHSNRRLFDIVSLPIMVAFSPRTNTLTFLESRKGAQALWNQPLDGGDPQPLLDLRGDRIFSFAYATDGRLAVAHGAAGSDVVLISGIH